MSRPYRLLSEGMPPPRSAGSASFAADPRRARQWVAALPRANPLATQQSLGQALDSLASQRLDGATRLGVLEELRPAIGESIAMLKSEYSSSPLPLDAARANAAFQVESFHFTLAQAYRKAAVEICAPEGNIPMLRGGTVALALARSAWHFSQSLAVAWRLYRAPADGVWQGLHRVHGFAVEQKLDTRQVADPLAGGSSELRTIYLRALLMAVTHPLAFSQGEQDLLWQVTDELATRTSLVRMEPEGNAPPVPEDADKGPGSATLDEQASRWLDISAFAAEVDAAISRQKDGFSTLMPARGTGVRVSVDMLLRLKRAFGLAAARAHARLPGGHVLRTVFGLSSLHFYLAGQRDFDAFLKQATQRVAHPVRAEWAHTNTDASRVPIHEGRVLDQSLGGYRMAWAQANQVRARVGELVGLTLADAEELRPDWMLGVVRWLRYEDDGGLSAGVELVARRTGAIGLRVHGKDGFAREPVRAVEMESLTEEGEIHFLAPNSMDTGAARIEVVRDVAERGLVDAPEVEEILAGINLLVNAGDYALLRPLRSDQAKPQPEQATT
jgi:hypothetical protein